MFYKTNLIMQAIIRAHNAGNHADEFYNECPICMADSYRSYLDESLQILRDMGRPDTTELFSRYLRSLVYDDPSSGHWTFHCEPVYTVALFFGIDTIGEELEADPLFQQIEAAAAPLRQKRLEAAAAYRDMIEITQ